MTNELYVGCALADTDNYLRCELDWDDRFRILVFVARNVTQLASDGTFSDSTNTWYDLTLNEQRGQVTFDLDTLDGTNVSSLTVDREVTLFCSISTLGGGGLVIPIGEVEHSDGPSFTPPLASEFLESLDLPVDIPHSLS